MKIVPLKIKDMINLNYNGVSAKLYRWFYGCEVPQNLCPYFWKLLFMYITIIPLSLFSLPLIIASIKDKDRELPFNGNIANLALYSVMLYFGLFFILCLFMWFASLFMHIGHKKMTETGLYTFFMIITTFITVAIINWRENREHNKTKNSNVLKEFIKAKYNRYCPKINWNNEN